MYFSVCPCILIHRTVRRCWCVGYYRVDKNVQFDEEYRPKLSVLFGTGIFLVLFLFEYIAVRKALIQSRNYFLGCGRDFGTGNVFSLAS